MTAEQRIDRLRAFTAGERGPYTGIADDIACLLEALAVAKLALDLSSPHEKALLADSEKHRDENAKLWAENASLRQERDALYDRAVDHFTRKP